VAIKTQTETNWLISLLNDRCDYQKDLGLIVKYMKSIVLLGLV